MSLFGTWGYFFNSTSPSEVHENTVPSLGNGIDAVSGRDVAVLPGTSQNEVLQKGASRPGSPASAENEGQKLSERAVLTGSSSAQVPAQSLNLALTETEIRQLSEQIMLAKTPEEIGNGLSQLEGRDADTIRRVLTENNKDFYTALQSVMSKPASLTAFLPLLEGMGPSAFIELLNTEYQYKNKGMLVISGYGSPMHDVMDKPESLSVLLPVLQRLGTDALTQLLAVQRRTFGSPLNIVMKHPVSLSVLLPVLEQLGTDAFKELLTTRQKDKNGRHHFDLPMNIVARYPEALQVLVPFLEKLDRGTLLLLLTTLNDLGFSPMQEVQDHPQSHQLLMPLLEKLDQEQLIHLPTVLRSKGRCILQSDDEAIEKVAKEPAVSPLLRLLQAKLYEENKLDKATAE